MDPGFRNYLDPDPFETLDVPFPILIFFSMGPPKEKLCGTGTGSDLNPDVEIRESKEEKKVHNVTLNNLS